MDTKALTGVINICVKNKAIKQLLLYEQHFFSQIDDLPQTTAVPALIMFSKYYFLEGDIKQAFDTAFKIKTIDPFHVEGRVYIFRMFEDFVKDNEGKLPTERLKNISKELYVQYSYLELSKKAPEAVSAGKSAKYYIDYQIERSRKLKILESKFDYLVDEILNMSKFYTSDQEAADYAAFIILNAKP